MKTRLKHPASYPTELHSSLLKSLQERGDVFSYVALYRGLMDVAKLKFITMGQRKSKLFIGYYLTTNKIEKKSRGVYVIK